MTDEDKKKQLALEIQERYQNLPSQVTAKDWYDLLTLAQKGLHLATLVHPNE